MAVGNLYIESTSINTEESGLVPDLSRLSEITVRVTVPFFGGFLGALGVALVSYVLGLIGIPQLVGLPAPALTQQGLQNISWGGAMWGFIPALFLIARKGDVYLISLLTMIIAVTYGLFVLQGLPLALTPGVIYRYIVNLTYALILALVIRASGLSK